MVISLPCMLLNFRAFPSICISSFPTMSLIHLTFLEEARWWWFRNEWSISEGRGGQSWQWRIEDNHQHSIICFRHSFLIVQWVSYRPYQIWTYLYHIFYNKLGTIFFICICSYSLPSVVCLNFFCWRGVLWHRDESRKWSTLSFLYHMFSYDVVL